ncbi:MAG: hypothetical protein GIW97_09330 [Candidatus Eremiobacteraeota bacterium]|nr:hypothetical protein [Candidatus Eremiobacteraeota bacterium]
MRYAITVLLAVALQALTPAPGETQTTDLSTCPSCAATAAAAQQSVIQSNINQQQISNTIGRALTAQQQTLQLQQQLSQLYVQSQLNQNNGVLQTILLQNQLANMQLQLQQMRARPEHPARLKKCPTARTC